MPANLCKSSPQPKVPIPTKHPLLLEDPTGLHLSFNDSLLALSIQHSNKHRGAIFLPVLGEK